MTSEAPYNDYGVERTTPNIGQDYAMHLASNVLWQSSSSVDCRVYQHEYCSLVA